MIRLNRAVTVTSFDAEATVAVGRDRPEFLAVARLAADLNRPIGARDILRELLGQRPEVLGWRVIERCVALGLLERDKDQGVALLSEAGRMALDHDEVLVPEEGIWRFFLVDDPLVPEGLIHAERLESEPVQREREAMKQARKQDGPRVQGERSPTLLLESRRELPRTSVQIGHLFQLLEVSDKGVTGPSGRLRLTLSWEAEPSDAEPSVRLAGRLSQEAKPFDALVEPHGIPERMSYPMLWKRLVAFASGIAPAELDRWSANLGRLVVPVTFKPLSTAARHAFQQDLDIPPSEWGDLGEFEEAVLKEVNLVPASEADAQAWLSWLQWEAIQDYALPDTLTQQGRALLARFPHHRPRPMAAAELLQRALRERDERAWFLLGPSDLGLWS